MPLLFLWPETEWSNMQFTLSCEHMGENLISGAAIRFIWSDFRQNLQSILLESSLEQKLVLAALPCYFVHLHLLGQQNSSLYSIFLGTCSLYDQIMMLPAAANFLTEFLQMYARSLLTCFHASIQSNLHSFSMCLFWWWK